MLRVGTRGSRLALKQTDEFIQQIKILDNDIQCEIVQIKTTGDLIVDKSLVDIGGKALFLKEIEESLLDNQIDVAIHSLKDVPAILPPSLIIPAVLARNTPLDVLIAQYSLENLPYGAIIGTCAVRRKAFLLNLLGDKVNVVDMRGNIDTRLNKLKSGVVDGIILAKAGLDRLKLYSSQMYTIPANVILPAIGQGVIAIECRATDHKIIEILSKINHLKTFICVTAERGFMIEICGNCKTPIAALASLEGDLLRLDVAFAAPNGAKIFKYSTQDLITNDAIVTAYNLGVKAAQVIKNDIRNSEYFGVLRELFEYGAGDGNRTHMASLEG